MSFINEYVRAIIREVNGRLDPVHAAAQYAHLGQKRRTGKPYISHPENVASMVKRYYPGNSVAYFSALLHDSLEDAIDQGNVESEEEMIALIDDAIEDDKIAEEVIEVVLALTKAKGSDYSDYLMSLVSYPDALTVKMADMLDNISDNPSENQKKKYSLALYNLEEYFGGKPSFINDKHWKTLKDIISNV